MIKQSLLILAFFSIILTSCSGMARAGSSGDPNAGKALFYQATIREAPACTTCHSIEPGKVIVGPSLAGIASRASNRKPDMSAQAYLRESVLDPNAYIVEGFSEGIMYPQFKDVLTQDEIDNLIAFLLTLE